MCIHVSLVCICVNVCLCIYGFDPHMILGFSQAQAPACVEQSANRNKSELLNMPLHIFFSATFKEVKNNGVFLPYNAGVRV